MSKFSKYIFLGFILFQANGCKKDNPYGDVEEALPPVLTSYYTNPTKNVAGYYVSLPSRYHTNSNEKKYPLIYCFHGAGAYGDSTKSFENVLEYGVIRWINAGRFPGTFEIDNKLYSFIVVAPQFISPPTNEEVDNFLNFALREYQIDTNRIYVAGSSVGARTCSDFAAFKPSKVSAVISMSGISDDRIYEKAGTLVQNAIPYWIFHNEVDGSWPLASQINFVNVYNSHSPLITPLLTIFNTSGHDAWIKGSFPLYEENGMNIYEWMLQYSKK